MSDAVLAWHFVGGRLRDGRPVPADGVTLRHEGPLVMCPEESDLRRGGGGFHASKRLIDALKHARGSTICRVRLGGEVLHDTDKIVARERTIIWRVEGAALLREFARRCPSDVLHLWPAPDVVREFLETGDESLRCASLDATWAVVRDNARAVVWDTAWVARDASEAAAEDVANDAQNDRLTAMVLAEAERQGVST